MRDSCGWPGWRFCHRLMSPISSSSIASASTWKSPIRWSWASLILSSTSPSGASLTVTTGGLMASLSSGGFRVSARGLAQHTIGEVSNKGRFHITQMSIPYRWLILFGLMGCESDLTKLQRLDTDRTIQCLNAEADYDALQKARPDPRKRTPQTDI